MKRALLIVAGAVAALAGAAAANAAPIYTDTLGTGALSVNPSDFSARLTPIVSHGLTISGGINYGNPQFGTDQAYFDDPGAISLTFANPVTGFGFDFTTIGVDLIVSAYGATNNLLESDVFSVGSLPEPEGYPTGYAGMAGLGAISRVVVTTAYGSGSVLIGTVSFLPGTVPEPTTWALMLLGFGAIGAATRRNRAGVRLA